MKINSLNEMVKGWFIGNFSPSIFRTKQIEIGVKYYSKGDYEKKHFHKIATEYTVIINGKVKMKDVEYSRGTIITIEPFEATDFMAITDATTVVVKIPSVLDDKYFK